MNIKINRAKLDRAIAVAFVETATELNESLHRSIVDPKWQWDRETVRRGGGVVRKVTSPRDIVNSGALRDSQAFVITGNTAQYSWNVPYALHVIYGYTTRSGTVVQGRDFIEDGLKSIDLGKIFAKKLRAKLK